MKRVVLFVALTTLMTLTCSAIAQTATQSQTSAGASSNTSVSAGSSGVNAQNQSSASASQKGAASANTSLGSGTTLNAVLTKSIDSRKAKEGDEVVAKTTSDLKAEGQRTIPKGTKLIGHVTKATAKANGDSDSSIAMIFDRAEVAKGREVPMHAIIQAVAATSNSSTMAMNEEPTSTASSSDGTPRSNSGGLGGAVAGVGKTVDNTAGTVAAGAQQAGGGALGSAPGTVNNTTSAIGGTATSTLSASSQGVVGLPGYTLNTASATPTQGSIITSSGKNVKLESGTQMVLRVTGQ